MILTAFDVKFHEKKDEIPPEACRPLKKLKKTQCRTSAPKTRETKQCRKSGSNKVEKKQCRKSGFIDSYIPSYTFIYLQIPSYTLIPPHTNIYLQILNISKMRANMKHKNGHNSGPRACPRVQFLPK